MNEQVIRLFKRGFVLIVIVFIIDRSVGSIIEHYHKKEKQGDSSVTTYALTKLSEDVIIFGSSRAAHHYVPTIIREKTNMTAFNVGRDGMSLSYYTALLKGILAHHHPKVVILDLNLNDFQLKENKKSAMVASLLPYVVDNPGIGNLIKEKEPIEYWKANISKLYRYNSLPASIAQHNMGIGQKNYNGYEPLKGNKLKSITDTIEINNDYREDAGLVKSFEEFVTILKNKRIPLYVIISPSSKKRKFNSKATASRILAKHGSKLYDYSKFSGENRVKLFYDATHMNDQGARTFTQVIVDDLLVNQI
jgi:hypothetical protein